jgi:hypothetical protein
MRILDARAEWPNGNRERAWCRTLVMEGHWYLLCRGKHQLERHAVKHSFAYP